MAVINWLVQGCVVAALTAAILRVLKSARAQTRYAICWIATVAVLVLPFETVQHISSAATATLDADLAPARALIVIPTGSWVWPSTVLAIAWTAWSIVCALQFVAAMVALRRARKQCRAFPPVLASRLPHWTRAEAHGRRARLMLSDDVRAAAVLGGAQPVIAVAPALASQLDSDDIDRVVIHEWAHVQRRDDFAQFLQIVCRIAAGWHPAVWWLNRRLNDEREMACDEVTVALTREAKAYAATLVKLAASPGTGRTPLASVGVLSSSRLAARIERIVASRRIVSRQSSRNAVVTGAVCVAAASLVVAAVPVVETVAVSTFEAASTPIHPAGNAQEPSDAAHADGARPARPLPAEPARTRQGATRQVPASKETAPDVRPAVVPAGADTPEPSGAAPEASALAPLPGALLPAVFLPTPLASTVAPSDATRDDNPLRPWTAAADAGRAVGQGSKNAGVATAGFFTRLGKRMSGSF